MAAVHFPFELGYVLAKEEVTYNTDPVPTASDFLYSEETSGNIQTNSVMRSGLSPKMKGWKSVATNKVGDLSGVTEIRPYEITGSGQNGQEHPIWIASGFNRTEDVAGDPKTVRYTLGSVTKGSATLYRVWLNEAEDLGILEKFTGFRCNTNIVITKNDRWRLEYEGMAAPSELPSEISGGALYTGLTTTDEDPLVGTGAKLSLYDVTAGLPFGGGTEASPLCEAFVDNLTISFNQGTIRRSGINCANGNGNRIAGRRGTEYAQVTGQLEITSLANWNFWAQQAEKRQLRLVIEQPPEAAGISGGRFVGTCVLNEFGPVADLEGDASVPVTMPLVYPESGGAFGNTPADLCYFEYFTRA